MAGAGFLLAHAGLAYGASTFSPTSGCTQTGDTISCSGDLSAGVSVLNSAPETVSTLNVATPINVPWISFVSDGVIVITSDAAITTQGAGLKSIYAVSTNGPAGADVVVTQTGNITSEAEGIFAQRHGAAGNVTVTQTGDITAQGSGIFANTFGGVGNVSVTQTGNISSDFGGIDAWAGGGDSGVTQTGNITVQGNDAFGIFARADAGSSTGAGTATVVQSGDIRTSGTNAFGVKASSAAPSGSVSTVTITQNGDIATLGDGAFGLYALSEGQSTSSGDVSVTQSGDITTVGAGAYGIQAQSKVMQRDAAGAVTVTQHGNITTRGADAYGIQASGAVDDGVSTDVTVTQSGNITTRGDRASGIIASSASGSPTMRSGDVTVTQTGDIIATGDNANGISATAHSTHSDSGNVTVTQTGNIASKDSGIFAWSERNSGRVTVTQSGSITTDGDGIYAWSGGGDVTVSQSGRIVAGSNGIRAHNDPATGTGATTIYLKDSIIQGGASDAGVFIESPKPATLNTSGVTTISALSGTAVLSLGGDDAFNNSGVLTTIGAVDLGTGTNFFNNMAGATFNSGSVVNLGVGNQFSNSGVLSPGGSNAIAATSITGNFVQTPGGELLADVNLGTGTGDLTSITGSAALSGNVRAEATTLAVGPQQITILSAAGGTSDNGLGVIASPVLNARLIFPNPNDVVLATNLDFTPATGLNRNQTHLADYFNLATAEGSGALDPLLMSLVNGPVDMAEYRHALNQLLPDVFLNSGTAALLSSTEFSNDLFSCHSAGTGAAFIRQGECVWVRPKGRKLEFDGTTQNIGYDDRATGLSAGTQFRFAPDWFANVAIGYERGTTETESGADSDSDRYQAGLSVKYQTGPWLLAGAVSGGVAQFETTRTIAFPDFAPTFAHSEHDVGFVTGQLHAAYLSDFGAWYAKPTVDARLTYLDRDGVRESGGGTANLWVDGSNETYVSISPAVEFGTEYAVDPDTTMKPFIKAGITYIANNNSRLTAGFVDAPSSIGSFTTASDLDDLFADIEAGVQIFKDNGTSLSFGYKGMVSDQSRQNGLFAKGTMNY